MMTIHPKPGGGVSAVAMALLLADARAAPPVKILPVGDSITAGALGGPNSGPFGRGGYRYFLERFLEASDGFGNYVVIGNSPFAGGTLVADAGKWFQNEKPLKSVAHSGYPGDSIEQIRDRIDDGSIPVAASDVILLQIGTNNVGYGSPVPATPAEISAWRSAYEDLLDAILAKSAFTKVVMAKIPPVADGSNIGSAAANAARIEPFNEEVVGTVHAAYSSAHPGRFFLVDNYSPIDPSNTADSFATATNGEDYFTGLGDGVHPYNAGHRKMAVNFWEGYQRARGKARTAIVTPLDDSDGDGFGGADVGVLGDGTLRQGRGTDVDDQPYVLAGSQAGARAKFYLKLDLSGLSKQWDEARFNLIFWGAPAGTPSFGNCCDDQPVTATVSVYGIADGGDDWTEDTITWATAPGNDPNGNGVAGTLLGQITVPQGLQTGEVVSMSTPALLDFVNLSRGSDGLVTLAVVGDDLDPGFRLSFQDSDFRDYAPAFLQLAANTVPPVPPDFHILGADFDLQALPHPEVVLNFASSGDQTYLVSASDDMESFDEVLASGIPGAPGASQTSVTVPLPTGRSRLFLRVEVE
ncbi:GDSL-type esterase/lipase family protein [Haloferula sp. A504]|uniref:GDSL-type esterase/lipase family protein n=1 Tax=Haloferula sp. A504 TaxID=3373601 RepID=UPI0031C9A463|nr:GDSL-type esterase/lipase family protein [Verrucomicrobiaceae bacterium E54]